MGKSKKRSIALGRHNRIENLSRQEAIGIVVEKLTTGEDVAGIITLFGLKPEEILEAGADYESVKAIEGIFLC